jgi:D-glycero-D-manno-heptose 1,7-bisphosphate phosphatase
MFKAEDIDGTWTLFLDRDGVLNIEKPGDYIYSYDEFVFYADALDAMKIFNQKFLHIILATNQRGVGRNLMTEQDLLDLHTTMVQTIKEAGGRIDRIYYNTSVDDNHPSRKPHPGMAFQARHDLPEIDFKKSIMVGNNLSDMAFGRNAGMHTVFLTTTAPEVTFPDPLIDYHFTSLYQFAKWLG